MVNSKQFVEILWRVFPWRILEHFLGKDEVPGSNPGISSMKRANQTICAFFLTRFRNMSEAIDAISDVEFR